jgi:hypothetical protein
MRPGMAVKAPVLEENSPFQANLRRSSTGVTDLPESRFTAEVTEKNKVNPMRVFGNTRDLMRVNPT